MEAHETSSVRGFQKREAFLGHVLTSLQFAADTGHGWIICFANLAGSELVFGVALLEGNMTSARGLLPHISNAREQSVRLAFSYCPLVSWRSRRKSLIGLDRSTYEDKDSCA